MVGIQEILNYSDGSDESTKQTTTLSTASQARTPSVAGSFMSKDGPGIAWEANKRRGNIPKCKINKKYLTNKKLVQISIRRKSANRKSIPSESTPGAGNISKLHMKYLEARMQIKLTMSPSIFSLYNALIPHTNRKQIYAIKDHKAILDDLSSNMETILPGESIIDRNMVSKSMQLIDNNLVNLAGYSNKVLLTFSKKTDGDDSDLTPPLPTFNSLDTAVSSLFGVSEYTLVRVTRSTSSDDEGSVILKLEAARPGDYSLIDEVEFSEEMVHSIGRHDDIPNNLFIKKIVARPRYKSDMKIFLIPKIQNSSLYVDERMFERDIINGVIEFDLSPSIKSIFCTFKIGHIINMYKNLLSLTRLDDERNENEDKVKDTGESSDTEIVVHDSN